MINLTAWISLIFILILKYYHIYSTNEESNKISNTVVSELNCELSILLNIFTFIYKYIYVYLITLFLNYLITGFENTNYNLFN